MEDRRGREEVGNTKEEEAVVTSEVKQDRERWEIWKMSLKSCWLPAYSKLSLQK